MDDKLARTEAKLEKIDSQVANHETRLVQIETAIFGPISPDRLRLPRQ